MDEVLSLADGLKDWRAGTSMILASVCLSIAYVWSRRKLRNSVLATAKQRAWVLTVISSSVLSLSSIPFLYTFSVQERFDVTYFDRLRLTDPEPRLMSLAVFMCSFFLVYLILDLAIGAWDYRAHLDVLTGWLHHTAYALLMLTLLKYRLGPVFSICCVLELPTLVLALGHVNKRWRRDVLFGILFFTTRIAFHGYLILQFIMYFPGKWWMILASIYPMHLFWFSSWVLQQRRLLSDRRNGYSSTDTKGQSDETLLVRPKALTETAPAAVHGSRPIMWPSPPSLQKRR